MAELFLISDWCVTQTVWPDLAKFSHLSKILIDVGNFWRAYLVLGKKWNLLWQNNVCYWAKFYCFKWPKLKTQTSNRVTVNPTRKKKKFSKDSLDRLLNGNLFFCVKVKRPRLAKSSESIRFAFFILSYLTS